MSFTGLCLYVCGIILLVLSLLLFLGYGQYTSGVEECKAYNNNGFHTQWSKSYWDEGPYCLIFLEDGSKIPLRDFKVTYVAKPLR